VVRRFTKNELEGKWLGEENEENGVDKEHPGITSSISNVVSGGHSAAGCRAKKFISSSLSSKARSDGLQPVDQLKTICVMVPALRDRSAPSGLETC